MTYFLKDALLQNYDAETLKGIVPEMADSTPAELARAAAERLLQPEVMRRRMMFLHDDDIAFFNYACRGKTSVAKANYAAADRLRELNYGFVTDARMTFRIPDDVVSAFEGIDDDAFRLKRQKMSWLLDCARLVPLFYSVMSAGDFCRLYRRKKERQESNEEILIVMLPELFRNADPKLVLQGGELIHQGLLESGNIGKIRQLHREYPVSFPSYGEIRNITADFYPSSAASYKKLKQIMIRLLSVSPETAEAMLEAVFINIAVGTDCDYIFEVLAQHGLAVNDAQKDELKPYMLDAWLDTRCLMFNGECPRRAAPQLSYLFFQTSGGPGQ